MSTLQTANITDGTNSVETVYVARGSAKAWLSLNGTGTIVIQDSLNMSGVTDNGTGDYTGNFSTAFDAGNYAGQISNDTVNQQITSRLAASIQVGTFTSLAAAYDSPSVQVSVHGDLA